MYPRSSCCVPKLAFLSRMVSSMFHPEVSAALLFTLIFELVEGLFSGVKCPLCEQLGQDFITNVSLSSFGCSEVTQSRRLWCGAEDLMLAITVCAQARVYNTMPCQCVTRSRV